MRVFVTGGTGWIGSAVIRELIGKGHEVTALARSASGVERVRSLGARAKEGDVRDARGLHDAARETDAVVHCAFNHKFAPLDLFAVLLVRATRIAGLARLSPAARMDLNAIDALLAGLQAGTSSTKVLVSTSGIACLPQGRVGTERDPGRTNSPAAWRVASERLTLAGARRGVRTAVMRLPPSVHGAGDQGFATWFLKAAREKGASAYVGTGETRWSAVHRDDAAALYRLAVEGLASGVVPGGSILHGVAEVGVPFRDVAAAIADRLGFVPPQPARRGHFPFLLRTIAQLDVPATSETTQKLLGWHPMRPGLLEDLRTSYETDA